MMVNASVLAPEVGTPMISLIVERLLAGRQHIGPATGTLAQSQRAGTPASPALLEHIADRFTRRHRTLRRPTVERMFYR
jgi:hypothetical protein